MPSVYTPSQTFKEGSEKEWPAKLGGLDWDSTRIVFTKRSLIEFLRYAGTSVDPNLNNIAKLPRYADFGKLHEDPDAVAPGISKAIPGADAGDAFKPSRRVRSVPGGAQTFTFGDGSDDVLENAPPKSIEIPSIPEAKAPEVDSGAAVATAAPDADSGAAVATAAPVSDSKTVDEPGFKPSRRVRDGPGGPSSMSTLWDVQTEPEPFKPTRRVREGPGGEDSISQIF